jgi:hypothetical protein
MRMFSPWQDLILPFAKFAIAIVLIFLIIYTLILSIRALKIYIKKNR